MNNEIATNKEQSEKLLSFGIDKMTADCYIEEDGHIIIARDDYDLEVALKYRHLTPSWSMPRLIKMMPDRLFETETQMYILRVCPDKDYWFVDYKDTESDKYLEIKDREGKYTEGENILDALISCIDWLIKYGHFNNKYLG